MGNGQYPFDWEDVGERAGGDGKTPLPSLTQVEKENIAAKWNKNHKDAKAKEWLTRRIEGKTTSHRDAQNRRIVDSVEKGYPSITDQLDIQYWDQVNGTDNWKTLIDDVKARFPKLE